MPRHEEDEETGEEEEEEEHDEDFVSLPHHSNLPQDQQLELDQELQRLGKQTFVDRTNTASYMREQSKYQLQVHKPTNPEPEQSTL